MTGSIRVTVDGRPVELDCAGDDTLLEALRDFAEIDGLSSGCLIGLCGACTLLLDGRPVRPCAVTAGEARGKAITTMAGLRGTELGRALNQAWSELQVSPCGQCAAGQMLASAALLASDPAPADEDVDAVLGEHVCDCRDRGDPRAAVRLAVRLLRG
jgi:isoquinoline 1-oxidoreductase subunit alpha